MNKQKELRFKVYTSLKKQTKTEEPEHIVLVDPDENQEHVRSILI